MFESFGFQCWKTADKRLYEYIFSNERIVAIADIIDIETSLLSTFQQERLRRYR